MSKLTNYIQNIASKQEDMINIQLASLVLSTVYILLENCNVTMSEHLDKLAHLLINMQNFKNTSIRHKTGKCLLSILKVKQDLLVYNRSVIFSFFSQCLHAEFYEMNFTACEFFLMVMEDDDGKLIKKNEINEEFSSYLNRYVLNK